MNMNALRHPQRAVVFSLLMASACLVGAEDFSIIRQSSDSGGAVSSMGGVFALDGTIGQPDAGALSGGAFDLDGGFWFAVAPGDCDVDGGVGLFDFTSFYECTSGPAGGPVSADCACFDFDADDDVDLLDFRTFQVAFNASN